MPVLPVVAAVTLEVIACWCIAPICCSWAAAAWPPWVSAWLAPVPVWCAPDTAEPPTPLCAGGTGPGQGLGRLAARRLDAGVQRADLRGDRPVGVGERLVERGALRDLGLVERGERAVEAGVEIRDRRVDVPVELGRRAGSLGAQRPAVGRGLLLDRGELCALVLAQRDLGLGQGLRSAGERPVAHRAGAVERALPALIERLQARGVRGGEVAARFVGDLMHRRVIGGAALLQLRDLLVALLGELVAVGLTDLLGGVGLGIAAVVGQRAVEEAVVAVNLVAAVLGCALRRDRHGVRARGGCRRVKCTLGLRVKLADLRELARLGGPGGGDRLLVRGLDLGARRARRGLDRLRRRRERRRDLCAGRGG
jgi:hypothetical protein